MCVLIKKGIVSVITQIKIKIRFIMSENIANCNDRGFWIDAHHYVINCDEPHFAQEIAFIMTTLHDEGC